MCARDPEAAKLFTLDAYVADPAIRRRAWQGRRDHAAWTSRSPPSPAPAS
ncbi:hypothetical protein [Solwaraspora sp. WMMD792]|nr:hypothetical protein [Solwaraspora sp. WMMD792]MDG4771624.1 hypothetical protein [Solwaraspora sp. WMMD792]